MNGEEGSVAKAESEDVLKRSVFVNHLHPETIPGDLLEHFRACGRIARVTLASDAAGNPRGYAYVEFGTAEGAAAALAKDGAALRGNALQILPKRENLPGMRARRPRASRRAFGSYRGAQRGRGYRGSRMIKRGVRGARRPRRF